MEQIFNFICNTETIDKEFTYVDRRSGVTMQGPQHTCQILEALSLSEQQKKSIADELPFASEDFFDTKMFSGQYSFVFLSMLHESHLGIYRRKSDGVKVVFGEAAYPMTEEKYFEDYVKQKVYTGGCTLTGDFLEWFKENYTFCGHTGVAELKSNILEILRNLSEKAKLILMLGVEYPCEVNTNPAFAHSHEVFAEQNSMIRKLAEENDRIGYIYYGDYLDGQDGFYKNNYHFTPAVYYQVAEQICSIINGTNGADIIQPVSEKQIQKAELKKKLRGNKLVVTLVQMIKAVRRLVKK